MAFLQIPATHRPRRRFSRVSVFRSSSRTRLLWTPRRSTPRTRRGPGIGIARDGRQGRFWYPHVYMTVTNPWDVTGTNAFGRWFMGPGSTPPPRRASMGARWDASRSAPCRTPTISLIATWFPRVLAAMRPGNRRSTRACRIPRFRVRASWTRPSSTARRIRSLKSRPRPFGSASLTPPTTGRSTCNSTRRMRRRLGFRAPEPCLAARKRPV